MSGTDSVEDCVVRGDANEAAPAELLGRLLQRHVGPAAAESAAVVPSVVVGHLVALADSGRCPLVSYPDLRGSATPAGTIVDLHGSHIGQPVVLAFDGGDCTRPIIMGVLRGATAWPLDPQPGNVEIHADGQRMVVTASEQLVLRCGQASITLTQSGKVLIQGSYLLSQSTGTNRVKGGSVQLN